MIIKVMSKELNIDVLYILKICRFSKYYYKTYRIPKKKKGQYRTIYHPAPILKTLQYWLINNLFIYLPVSDFAQAYNKGCSIAKNASFHLGKRHVLHMDIKDFFPSITTDHLDRVLKKNKEVIDEIFGFKIKEADRKLIHKIVFFDEELPIGGVTSPIVSNIIFKDIDEILFQIGLDNKCVYTRYADDMVFSSESFINKTIVSDIHYTLKRFGFETNLDKVYFMGPSGRRSVTGVVINNERLTVGRKLRDEIKTMVYKKIRYGIGDNNTISGYLSYLNSIDPTYYQIIFKKYSGLKEILRVDT